MQLRTRESAVCGKERTDRRPEERYESNLREREGLWRSRLRLRLVCESWRLHSGDTDQSGICLHKLYYPRRTGRRPLDLSFEEIWPRHPLRPSDFLMAKRSARQSACTRCHHRLCFVSSQFANTVRVP